MCWKRAFLFSYACHTWSQMKTILRLSIWICWKQNTNQVLWQMGMKGPVLAPVCFRNNGIIMSAMASQITSITNVYLSFYSYTDQRKYHKSSASLASVRGIHRWPVNSPHRNSVTRKMFMFDDAIMRIPYVWIIYIYIYIYIYSVLLRYVCVIVSWCV